jgi:hypothetical protein
VTPGLNALAKDNLITAQAAAIEDAARAMFPAGKFNFEVLPAALTREVWAQTFRRLPAVAVQFASLAVDARSGRLPNVTATWNVYLVLDNPAGPASRLLGDAAAPGLAGMMVLAMLALHGLSRPGLGSARVTAAEPLGAEWLPLNVAAAGLTLAFGPDLLIDPAAADGLADFLRHGAEWDFPTLAPAVPAAPFSVR